MMILVMLTLHKENADRDFILNKIMESREIRSRILELKKTKIKGRTNKCEGEITVVLRRHYNYAIGGTLFHLVAKHYVEIGGSKKHPLYRITEAGIKIVGELN